MRCLTMNEPDDLFDRPSAPVKPFEFDADVARVFPDMVRRSVPGYAELVGLTGLIARRVVRPGTRCYDLGCSLGAVTRELLLQTPEDVPVIAVDASEAMIDGIWACVSRASRGSSGSCRSAPISKRSRSMAPDWWS
jgi:tRNA (cmo5U34)-methyltransferase